ncbi:hypothetical protein VPH35_113077 [Triticum aestivum]
MQQQPRPERCPPPAASSLLNRRPQQSDPGRHPLSSPSPLRPLQTSSLPSPSWIHADVNFQPKLLHAPSNPIPSTSYTIKSTRSFFWEERSEYINLVFWTLQAGAPSNTITLV